MVNKKRPQPSRVLAHSTRQPDRNGNFWMAFTNVFIVLLWALRLIIAH